MKISFDFDSTLTKPSVFSFALHCIKWGNEVWVITSRSDDKNSPTWIKNGVKFKPNNDDLFKITDSLGILRERVIFTNHELKSDFIRGKGFLFHIDDDWVEIKSINETTETIGISCFGTTKWKQKAMKLLNNT